jgi:hypothetical protein
MIFQKYILLAVIILSAAGCLSIIRFDWKRYGLIYIISAITGNLLCFCLTYLGFYTFYNYLLEKYTITPILLVATLFPLIALFGIRYSPKQWIWKIPFYWGIVHLGVLGEVILKNSIIFKFEPEWDLWDSYTLWWINYLLFELLGGKIIPPEKRKPLAADSMRYGAWAWIMLHVIFITTIFLAGIYVGVTVFKK